ncbi:programmed cell death protein, putative [Entamoeba invadens IP1]|uniref:Programmed cell death protein, putative n=1 Tax=Entamoeba invadens IP1 TaxID=370355 RepID=A0A0A1U8K2_ENTIV|nr:programmed cell death protein, putative [Entamoeba invadens IP1]ELP88313.1 programmed cell death protein, putative [Entamoeba invadens IP1]|eukprot:XP_004255084.1 programmed cell death protein, putative [Entamoeba invadens IP1]
MSGKPRHFSRTRASDEKQRDNRGRSNSRGKLSNHKERDEDYEFKKSQRIDKDIKGHKFGTKFETKEDDKYATTCHPTITTFRPNDVILCVVLAVEKSTIKFATPFGTKIKTPKLANIIVKVGQTIPLTFVSQIGDNSIYTYDVREANQNSVAKAGSIWYGVVKSKEEHGYIITLNKEQEVFVEDIEDESSSMSEESEHSEESDESKSSKEEETNQMSEDEKSTEEDSSEDTSSSDDSTQIVSRDLFIGAVVQIYVTEAISRKKLKGRVATVDDVVSSQNLISVGCRVPVGERVSTGLNGYIYKVFNMKTTVSLLHYSEGAETAIVVYNQSELNMYSISMLPQVNTGVFSMKGKLETTTQTEFMVNQVGKHLTVGTSPDGETLVMYKNKSSYVSVPDMSQEVHIGYTLEGVVVSYDAFNGVYVVSNEPEVIENIDKVKGIGIGAFVEGKVKTITKSYLVISVSKYVTGICFRKHVAEIPPDDLSDVFVKGQSVKARVLSIKNNAFEFTMKKSYMVPELSIIASTEDALDNQITYAMVDHVDPKTGVNISFFGDVKGYVPIVELFDHRVEAISLFSILRVRVSSVEKGKITASLNLYPKEGKVDKIVDLISKFQVGEIYSGTVIGKRMNKMLVRLRKDDASYVSILPNHYVEDGDDGSGIQEKIKNGSVFEQCLVLSNIAGKITITTKKSLIALKSKIAKCDSYQTLEEGVYVGCVNFVGQFKAVVVFYNHVQISVHAIDITNDQDKPMNTLLKLGQTVVGKVRRAKEVKHFNMRENAGYCMPEEAFLLPAFPQKPFVFGSEIVITVDETQDYGIIGSAYLDNTKYTTFTPKAGIKGEIATFAIGNTFKAVVIGFDQKTNIVDAVHAKLIHPNVVLPKSIRSGIVVLNKQDFCVVISKSTLFVVNKQRLNGGYFTVGKTTEFYAGDLIEDSNKVYTGTVAIVKDKKEHFKSVAFDKVKEVRIGENTTGVVSEVYPHQYIITLDNGVEGRLHKINMPNTSLSQGDKVEVKVCGFEKKDGVFVNNPDVYMKKYVELSQIETPHFDTKLPLDKKVSGWVVMDTGKCLLISFNSFMNGKLSYVELGDTLKEVEIAKKQYTIGDTIEVIPKIVDNRMILTLDSFNFTNKGQVVLGRVLKTEPALLRMEIEIRGGNTGFVDYTEMSNVYPALPFEYISVDDYFNVKLLKTGELGTKYFTMRPEYLKEEAQKVFPVSIGSVCPIVERSKIVIGQRMLGYVISSDNESGVVLHVGSDIEVIVPPEECLEKEEAKEIEITKHFVVGRLVRVMIEDIDGEDIFGTLNHAKLYPGAIVRASDAVCGKFARAVITAIYKSGLFFRFHNSNLRAFCHCSQIETGTFFTFSVLNSRFKVGDSHIVKIIQNNTRNGKPMIRVSIKAEDIADVDIPDESEVDYIDMWHKEDCKRFIVQKIQTIKKELKDKIGVNDEFKEPKEVIPVEVDWDEEGDVPLLNIVPNQKRHRMIRESSESSEQDVESEDEMEVEREKEQPKEEPREEQKEDEENEDKAVTQEMVEDLYEIAQKDQNNSEKWIELIRAVRKISVVKALFYCQTALRNIALDKTQDRENIWKAYLQIEAKYRTNSEFQTALQDALRVCDVKKILFYMRSVFKSLQNISMEENMYTILLQKVKGSGRVYRKMCSFYMRTSREENAMVLLSKARKMLTKPKYMKLRIKMAQLQYKYGSVDKGRSMFESILEEFPKRYDLWNVYLDMESRVGETPIIRRLFERIVAMKLSTKSMKTFLTKYLKFETNNGDNARMEHVRQIAQKYVESK